MDNIRGGYIFKTVTDKEHIHGGFFLNRHGYLDIRGDYIL